MQVLIEMHRIAVLASVAVVSRVTGSDLRLPTPCSEWTVGDLLAHMTVQHNGFAAAAWGRGGEPEVWRVRPLGADPVGEYTAAAERVLAAFGEDGVLEREFVLPEIKPLSRLPGARAIGFHLVDYVVHGWDVAVSIGIPYVLHPDLEDIALKIALAVPNGDNRLAAGAAFGPARSGATDTPLDRILTALGRSPTWPAT